MRAACGVDVPTPAHSQAYIRTYTRLRWVRFSRKKLCSNTGVSQGERCGQGAATGPPQRSPYSAWASSMACIRAERSCSDGVFASWSRSGWSPYRLGGPDGGAAAAVGPAGPAVERDVVGPDPRCGRRWPTRLVGIQEMLRVGCEVCRHDQPGLSVRPWPSECGRDGGSRPHVPAARAAESA